MNRLSLGALLLVALPSCTAGEDPQSQDANVRQQDEPELSLYRAGNRFGWTGQDPYVDGVQKVIAQRCTSCHGCGDSPCQLKLTSYEGLRRGSNETNNFGTDPTEQILSRIPFRLKDFRTTDAEGHVDWAATEQRWRNADYYSVLDGGRESVMYKLLDEAHSSPIESRDLGPAFALYNEGPSERNFVCLGKGEPVTDEYLRARAMPFGLEKIEGDKHALLTSWLEAGAPGPTRAAEAELEQPLDPATIAKWESFFNQESAKGQLVARYLFEHLFFAHLVFPEMPGEYYELVRSYTPAPQPIQEVVTELAYDAPGNGKETVRPFYRLKKYTSIVVQKSHTPWVLDDGVMARWTELFLDPEYEVTLPDYSEENPFENFHQLPSMSRARFMQENSYELVDAMVKADVCTGTSATYAIRDRFWVWFMNPENDPSAHDPRLGHSNYLHLNPSGFDLEGRYQESFEEKLRELNPNGLGLDAIWDGNGGTDTDAWLTVLRHGESTTVHRGARAGRPETAWLLSYSNFERLYYNLVVDFSAWDAIASKAVTWKYMSSVRTEGEDLWISMLPEEYRQPMRDQWSQEFGSLIQDTIQGWIEGDMHSEGRPSQIAISGADPMGELLAQGRTRIGETVAGGPDSLNPHVDPRNGIPERELPSAVNTFDELEQAFSTLSGWRGAHAQVFPNVTILRVHDDSGEQRVYTVVANRGYLSHDLLTGKERARNPEQDVLSTLRGIAGAYPELFIDMPLGASATEFVKRVHGVRNQEDWNAVMDDFGTPDGVQIIQRDHAEFWPFLDFLHDWYVHDNPVDSGILDISEYVWPARLSQ